jgi:hypothetical protein
MQLDRTDPAAAASLCTGLQNRMPQRATAPISDDGTQALRRFVGLEPIVGQSSRQLGQWEQKYRGEKKRERAVCADLFAGGEDTKVSLECLLLAGV